MHSFAVSFQKFDDEKSTFYQRTRIYIFIKGGTTTQKQRENIYRRQRMNSNKNCYKLSDFLQDFLYN